MTDALEFPVTLIQALAQRAAHTPERVALRFLADDPQEQVVLTYRELDLRARIIAGALQARTTFAGQHLSYAELDARANQLARVLRERGWARRYG